MYPFIRVIPSFYDCAILSEMNKKQKIVLIIFAIVDVIIVAVLAGTILRTWSSYPASLVQSSQLSCADYYLNALQTADRQVTFALQNDAITITVSLPATEDLDDAELLWTLIDQVGQIAPKTKVICQEPRFLTIQLNVSRENVTNNHITIITLDDLIQWTQGNVSEEYFAANIKYRQIAVTPD